MRSRTRPPATSRPWSTIATDSHIASAVSIWWVEKIDRPAPVAQLGEGLAQQDQVDRVEARERLVHQQDLGVVEDRRDELDLLLVALRQLLGAARRVLGDAEAIQPAERVPARPRRLHAVQRAEVDELVEDVHPRVEPALLGQVAPRAARHLADRPAVPADRTVVGDDDPEADPHRRRLARAVGAEEAEDLAATDLEGQAVEGRRAAEALGDVVDLEAHRRRIARFQATQVRPVAVRTTSASSAGASAMSATTDQSDASSGVARKASASSGIVRDQRLDRDHEQPGAEQEPVRREAMDWDPEAPVGVGADGLGTDEDRVGQPARVVGACPGG